LPDKSAYSTRISPKSTRTVGAAGNCLALSLMAMSVLGGLLLLGGCSPALKGKGASGRAQFYVNGKLAGQDDIPVTVPLLLSLGEGLSVGKDPGSPVSKLYPPPFEFTGTIFKVTAHVSGKMIQDTEEEQKAMGKAHMARQ
jgi:hypothetical protein